MSIYLKNSCEWFERNFRNISSIGLKKHQCQNSYSDLLVIVICFFACYDKSLNNRKSNKNLFGSLTK